MRLPTVARGPARTLIERAEFRQRETGHALPFIDNRPPLRGKFARRCSVCRRTARFRAVLSVLWVGGGRLRPCSGPTLSNGRSARLATVASAARRVSCQVVDRPCLGKIAIGTEAKLTKTRRGLAQKPWLNRLSRQGAWAAEGKNKEFPPLRVGLAFGVIATRDAAFRFTPRTDATRREFYGCAPNASISLPEFQRGLTTASAAI
jgi:hypothetical protein